MLYRHRILTAGHRVVLVRASGPFDLERSVDTLAALEFPPREDRAWRGLVWDVRRRTVHPDAAQVRELVTYFKRWDRVAVVAEREVQYGLGRMANILLESVVPFRSLREGLAWAGGTATE